MQTTTLALITSVTTASPTASAPAAGSVSKPVGRGASEDRVESAQSPTPTVTSSANPKTPTSPTIARTAGPGTSAASLENTSSAKYGRFGRPLSKNPYDTPSQHLRSQRTSASATTVKLLERLAGYPIADWYGGSTTSVRSSVAYRVTAAAKRRSVAQLVVYNLPDRDCYGAYSASTLTAAQYRTWFRGFVAGLGSHKAIVILEPDALMQLGCLTSAQRTERYTLMSWATGLLRAQGSWTYLDAGHSAGVSVSTTASRLRSAGVANATGFSLNVSGFRSDVESIRFGTAISKRVGGKHFLIDSSRNGVAPTNADWCNPSGKRLGQAPTARTGVRLLDAYLWVKTPGSSDGTCNGGPSSGAWFQSSALALARFAHLGSRSTP